MTPPTVIIDDDSLIERMKYSKKDEQTISTSSTSQDDNIEKDVKRMNNENPTDWPMAVWLLAIGAAMAGGLIRCYTKSIGQKMTWPLFIKLFFEWLIASILGTMVFMLLIGLGYREAICAFFASVTASMSTSLLSVVQAKITDSIKKL